LMPGERIVVSGTFLIDSESRMKAAAAGIYGETSEDPNCGMEVDISKAKVAGRTSEYGGKTYYFCSDYCKVTFDKDPARYPGKPGKARKPQLGAELRNVQWGETRPPESAHLGHMHPPTSPSSGPR